MKGRFVELRPVALGDLDQIAEWRNGDIASSRQVGLCTRADMLAWFERVNAPGKTEHAFVVMAKEFEVGYVRLCSVDLRDGVAEVGYLIAPTHRGKGLGTDAVRTIVEFGFRMLALERIEAEVYAFNVPSQKLLERLGFKREGCKRSAVRRVVGEKPYPQRWDAIQFGLLAHEFYQRLAFPDSEAQQLAGYVPAERTVVDGAFHVDA